MKLTDEQIETVTGYADGVLEGTCDPRIAKAELRAVFEAYRTGQTMAPDYVQRTQSGIKTVLRLTDPNKEDKS